MSSQRQSTPRQSLESLAVLPISRRGQRLQLQYAGLSSLGTSDIITHKEIKDRAANFAVSRNACATQHLHGDRPGLGDLALPSGLAAASGSDCSPSAVICLAPRKVDGGARLARTLLPSALKALGETCIGPCHTRPNRQPHIPDIIHHDRPPRASIPSAWLLA